MCRTTAFIKSARKNIYVHGKRVELIHQKGKNSGQKYIKLDRTQPENEKDEILKFFYGEDFSVLDISELKTRGLIKEKNGKESCRKN